MENVSADVMYLATVPFFYFKLAKKVEVFVSAVNKADVVFLFAELFENAYFFL